MLWSLLSNSMLINNPIVNKAREEKQRLEREIMEERIGYIAATRFSEEIRGNVLVSWIPCLDNQCPLLLNRYDPLQGFSNDTDATTGQ